MGIRKLASVALQPVRCRRRRHSRRCISAAAAIALASAIALSQADAGSDLAYYAQQLHMLAWTVGGLIFGSIPPAAIAPFMPHPVVATTVCATLGVTCAGVINGTGYYQTLKTYLTKGKDGQPKGCGDVLMSFLGVVVLSFGFHIFGQRALLVRHAAEVVGCAALASLLSMVVTASAGRAFGLDPELSLALVPRSVTVALAMPIASQLGVPEESIPICAASVLVTGLTGAVLCHGCHHGWLRGPARTRPRHRLLVPRLRHRRAGRNRARRAALLRAELRPHRHRRVSVGGGAASAGGRQSARGCFVKHATWQGSQ